VFATLRAAGPRRPATAGDIEFARGLEKFFRDVELLRFEGRPSAPRRRQCLERRIGGKRERLLPQDQRIGRFILRVVQFGECLGRVLCEFPRRLLVDEGLQQRTAIRFLLRGEIAASEQIIRGLL